MNIITVTGNNVKPIELKYTPSGTAISNGSIAVRRDFKNKETNEYETDFFNFTVIGKMAEVVANYVQKGDKFGITGRLQNRIWEKDDGSKQYFTEIIVNGFDFPTKQGGNSGNTNQKPNNNSGGTDSFTGNGQIQILDDDLPF
jgi:single-strand DNA-binding protein